MGGHTVLRSPNGTNDRTIRGATTRERVAVVGVRAVRGTTRPNRRRREQLLRSDPTTTERGVDMSKKKGWRCVLCGTYTTTRNYAVLRMDNGYILETPWTKRVVCDSCLP